jgi:hypothetical protein
MNPHWIGQRLHIALVGLLAGLIAPMQIAHAHEIRPAYLQIDEIGPGRYQLLWRTPVLSGMRLPVVLRLPDNIRDVTHPATQELSDSLLVHHVIDTDAPALAGKDRVRRAAGNCYGRSSARTNARRDAFNDAGATVRAVGHRREPWR